MKTWVPPGEVAPPEPAPIFKTVLIDGQLELAEDPPSQAERDEVLKRALYERLQTAVPDLARAAGNHFPKLTSKARILAGLVEKPFEQLDLLAIHFEVETLQDRLERGTEDGIAFTDDILGPLSDVTRVGPGLTLGHASVDLYIQRVREARENPSPAADQAAHRALSDAIIADPEANGPGSITMETRVAALENARQRQAGFNAKHQWLVWVVPTLVSLIDTGVDLSVGLVVLNFGTALTNFIATNATLLWEVALTYGANFAGWFASVMHPVFQALGAGQDILNRLRLRK